MSQYVVLLLSSELYLMLLRNLRKMVHILCAQTRTFRSNLTQSYTTLVIFFT